MKPKVIGYYDVLIAYNTGGPDTYALFALTISDRGVGYYMVAPGRFRRFFLGRKARRGLQYARKNLIIWQMGGPLPDGAKLVKDDVLGRMLDELVNKQLTGGNK